MAEHGIVVSPPPPPARAPKRRAPPKTADTHFHIFESTERYPLSPQRMYDPALSTVEDYREMADTIAEDLGYGEQRRLDLALALVGRPSVLLLDEPMAGLSVKESLDLAQHLKALTSRWEVSVLLVEHDMDVVFGISDVVTVFELGRVIASGEPAAVRADARVREAYLGSAA